MNASRLTEEELAYIELGIAAFEFFELKEDAPEDVWRRYLAAKKVVREHRDAKHVARLTAEGASA